MSEKQRDDALGTIKALNDKVEKLKVCSFKADDLRGMPIHKLKTLQVKKFLDFLIIFVIFFFILLSVKVA